MGLGQERERGSAITSSTEMKKIGKGKGGCNCKRTEKQKLYFVGGDELK
jgi:hypothetical protein